jgi:hypothetical protein
MILHVPVATHDGVSLGSTPIEHGEHGLLEHGRLVVGVMAIVILCQYVAPLKMCVPYLSIHGAEHRPQ